MTPDEHFDAANLCELDDKYAEAIDHYTQAIAQQPHFPEAHFNRAGNHAMLGQFRDAIADYNQAIRQGPMEPSSYIYLADIFLNEGANEMRDPVQAKRLAWKAFELTAGQDHHTLATLGAACEALGEYRAAAAYLRRALGILDGSIAVEKDYHPPVDAEIFVGDLKSKLSEIEGKQHLLGWRRWLPTMLRRRNS